jgi:hypothetical protein
MENISILSCFWEGKSQGFYAADLRIACAENSKFEIRICPVGIPLGIRARVGLGYKTMRFPIASLLALLNVTP